jgi:hypothetical protein
MRKGRDERVVSMNTDYREESDIDLLSKLESNFLEKYFRYILIDYFPEMFINIY